MTKTVLFLLGIACGVAGIVSASITGNWSIISISLIGLSVFLFLISLWWWGRQSKLWRKHSTKQSAKALVSTTLVFLALGLINVLGINSNIRWDLTQNKLFTLSPQSQGIVTQLKQPLQVIVFERNRNSELEGLLTNYGRYGEQFQFKFVDPEQNLGLAQQFDLKSLGEVYLQYGEKKQQLKPANKPNNATVSSSVTETDLTNAIAKITRDRPVNIYFLQGHGEAPLEQKAGGLAQTVSLLQSKGNIAQPLNLATNRQVPDNANLVVIAGATRKLLAPEISSLQEYLSGGGNLLLMLSPNTDLGIKPLLEEWGIELDNRLIVDGSGAGNTMGFGPAVVVVNNYADHPITANFGNGISIFPESQPLLVQQKSAIESIPFVITGKQTWAESDLSSEEITFNQKKDTSGPLNIAIASERSQPQPSRLVVFGSSTFATSGWFGQQLNGDIFLNSVSWLTGENQAVLSLRPKESANRRLNPSSFQKTVISWLATRIMPFMALVTVILIWWRRK